MKNIEKEIEKLKYQISILASTIDYDKFPVENLILSLNWDDNDLNAAHDIFEKYDQQLEENKPNISWSALEKELENKFNISYQTVKSIVRAFYKNGQWSAVCYHYAKAYQCAEFHSLISDYEQGLKSGNIL